MGIPDHLTCFLDFPGCSDGKASSYNAGDPGSIPGSGKSPKERNGNPLQNSCLENPMDEEPGRLPHTVSQRIGCDWTDFSFFICFLKSLYAGQKATDRTGHERRD